MEPATNDERSLLRQAQAGEVEAFGEVCQGYEARLLRQAMNIGCQISAAEDLVQETLVEAWKCLRRYDGRCRFFTWLCAILLNRQRGMLRRKRLLSTFGFFSAEAGLAEDRLRQLTAREPSPDEAAQLHDRALLVRECIAALPVKHQQVIYLRFYADDSLESIAAALGCSVGTVKSRLFHALEKLRRMKALGSPMEHLEPTTSATTTAANTLVSL